MGVVKKCTKCGLLKDLTGFYKNAKGKGGLQAHCKNCAKVASKEYRLTNLEMCRAKKKLYCAKNRDMILAEKKRYYENNRDRLIRKAREYELNNRDKVNAAHRNWNNKNIELRKLINKRYNTKSKGQLTDSYVKRILTKRSDLKFKDIPNELVEIKRTQLLIKRHIKEISK